MGKATAARPRASSIHNAVSRIALATAFAAACQASALAQPGTLFQWSYGAGEGGPNLDEPLITDRPDFTESSVTVGRGVVQLETGYTYISDNDAAGSVRAHVFPEALLRVGLFADWFELRIFWTYAEETTTVYGGTRDAISGSEDMGLGVKLALTGQHGILPEMAIVPQMTVPTGSSEFTADEVLPGLNLIYGWDLTDRLSLGGQTQGNRRLDNVTGEPYLEMSQSFTLGIGWTDRIGTYTEWFVFAPHSADTNPTEHYFDGGMTFLVTDNLQLDARAGIGLNEAAADMFAGLGASIRL